jgi:hypothetical protein
MKLSTSRAAYLIVFLCLTKVLIAQKEFTKLSVAADSTFGYTAQNPLKLKNGNQIKSIDYSRRFLYGLKTSDSQDLQLLYRGTTDDPSYKEGKIRITDRRTGLPISGKLGILDKYVFLTSVTRDTVILFVDIYNRGKLQLPVGLKYE